MAQYSTGKVSTSSGSNIITGTGTQWVTTGIKAGDLMLLEGDITQYQVTQVDTETQLRVSANMASTQTTINYTISKDFTANMGYPMVSPGDTRAAEILRRALTLIDTDIFNRTQLASGQMTTDLDMNGHDILDAGDVNAAFVVALAATIAGVTFGTANNKSYLDSGNADSALILQGFATNGKTGIGVLNPQDILDVLTSMRVSDAVDVINKYLKVTIGGVKMNRLNGDDDLVIETTGTFQTGKGGVIIRTNGVNRLKINNDGTWTLPDLATMFPQCDGRASTDLIMVQDVSQNNAMTWMRRSDFLPASDINMSLTPNGEVDDTVGPFIQQKVYGGNRYRVAEFPHTADTEMHWSFVAPANLLSTTLLTCYVYAVVDSNLAGDVKFEFSGISANSEFLLSTATGTASPTTRSVAANSAVKLLYFTATANIAPNVTGGLTAADFVHLHLKRVVSVANNLAASVFFTGARIRLQSNIN